jgi:hypothetical protein
MRPDTYLEKYLNTPSIPVYEATTYFEKKNFNNYFGQ